MLQRHLPAATRSMDVGARTKRCWSAPDFFSQSDSCVHAISHVPYLARGSVLAHSHKRHGTRSAIRKRH